MTITIFVIILGIAIFVVLYRNSSNSSNVYKFINSKINFV